MTDATELALDPEAVKAAKRERQQQLHAALTGLPTSGDNTDARDRLLELLGADKLAELDQRLLTLLAPDDSGSDDQDEPPGVFDAIAMSKAERRTVITNALLGQQAAVEEPVRTGGFDGGARQPAPRPPSEGDWLTNALKTRIADVGARL
jgi:hypothetical protein